MIGNPQWCIEKRFETLSARKENEDELDRFIEMWTGNWTPEEAMRMLQSEGIPAGVVENVEDMYKDLQLSHRVHFVKLDHPELENYSARDYAFRMSKNKCEMKAAPCLGEHTELVCKNVLGMSDEVFIRHLLNGVFN